MDLQYQQLTERDLTELAGRMYELMDLQILIEEGEFSTVAELAEHIKTISGRLNRTIDAGQAGAALPHKDCFLVLLE